MSSSNKKSDDKASDVIQEASDPPSDPSPASEAKIPTATTTTTATAAAPTAATTTATTTTTTPRSRPAISKSELRATTQIPGTHNRKRRRPASANDENTDSDDSLKDEGLPPHLAPVMFPDGTVEFSLAALHKYLICDLCNGYYRDPYTITDCLHTFCKACLYYAVACGCTECPTCHIFVGSDPAKVAVLDRNLKELMDKVIFPTLVDQERLQEEVFYTSREISIKPEFAHRLPQPQQQQQQQPGGELGSGNGGSEERSRRSIVSTTIPVHSKTTSSTMTLDASSSSQEDLMECTLLPELAPAGEPTLPRLQHPCLTVSGRLRMSQLKRYIVQKLPGTPSLGQGSVTNPSLSQGHHATYTATSSSSCPIPPTRIDILCNGVPLGDEISLSFVKRLLWHQEDSQPALTYRLATSNV